MTWFGAFGVAVGWGEVVGTHHTGCRRILAVRRRLCSAPEWGWWRGRSPEGRCPGWWVEGASPAAQTGRLEVCRSCSLCQITHICTHTQKGTTRPDDAGESETQGARGKNLHIWNARVNGYTGSRAAYNFTVHYNGPSGFVWRVKRRSAQYCPAKACKYGGLFL